MYANDHIYALCTDLDDFLTLMIGASFMNANGHNPYKTYLGGIAGTNELLNGHDENELGNLKHW